MMKYELKRIGISLIVYCLTLFIFSGIYGGPEGITERMPHQDSNMALIILITDFFIISKHMPNRNEIYRYDRVESYLIHKTCIFSEVSLFCHCWYLLANCTLLWLAKAPISSLSVVCSCHLWLISVILYMAVFVCTMDTKHPWYVWAIMIVVCILYVASSNDLYLLNGMSLFQIYLSGDASIVSLTRYGLWAFFLYLFTKIRKGEEL